jgi:DNA-binding response OmpR family regulator
VRWLRQKIEKEAGEPTRIVTVRGGGYRFEG